MDTLDDIDAQINKMQAYRNKLRQASQPQRLIWDEIDAEIIPMTDEQKARLLQDPEYAEVYTELQTIVQNEILNLVKGRIESTERGRELKNKIISDTNREMELFNRFREYSKQHPDVTYEDFIKAIL